MMQDYKWERFGDKYYYFNSETGKIVGAAHKLALQEVCIAIVYTGLYTFTLDDERHLGQYINLDYAKRSVEFYWERESRTLLAGPEP